MRTTLNKLYDTGAPGYCQRGWKALLNHVGKIKPDDDEISINTIFDAIGLQGATWCLRTIDCEHEKQEYSLYCTEPHTEEEIRLKFLELFGD